MAQFDASGNLVREVLQPLSFDMPQTAPLAEHAAVAHALSLLLEPRARLKGYELVTDFQSVVTAHERGEAWVTSYKRPFAGVWIDAEPWNQLVVTKVRAHQLDHCSAEQQQPPLLNDMPNKEHARQLANKHIDALAKQAALMLAPLDSEQLQAVCMRHLYRNFLQHVSRQLCKWKGVWACESVS